MRNASVLRKFILIAVNSRYFIASIYKLAASLKKCCKRQLVYKINLISKIRNIFVVYLLHYVL
jgi:hypothetical protein